MKSLSIEAVTLNLRILPKKALAVKPALHTKKNVEANLNYSLSKKNNNLKQELMAIAPTCENVQT